MTSPFQQEVEVAQRLARQAGELALRYRSRDNLDVELKPGNEPVTIADRKASELIIQGLLREFPGDVVISEEHADDLARLGAERVWYIDPIDGTKDYIRGLEGFAVMIGLTLHHRPVVGVVYQPTRDQMFMADGERAWRKLDNEPPLPLRVSSVQSTADIRLVASKSSRSRKIDRVKSALGITDELNIGSVGLKLALIALGERDLYVNPSPRCKTWDTCAPEALLVAAGGRITDVFGEPLRYDLEDSWRRSGLVASNGLVHEQVIERLRPLFPKSHPVDDVAQ